MKKTVRIFWRIFFGGFAAFVLLLILANYGAVSYTHLDVYKRQNYDRSISRTTDLIMEIYARLAATVSYTHLDVYKRQLFTIHPFP